MSFPLVKRSADFSRGPSASIWAPFNAADFIRNRGLGHEVWSDFLADDGPFLLWQDGGNTVLPHTGADLFGGVVRFGATTDNEQCAIVTRGYQSTINGTSALDGKGSDLSGFLISDTAGRAGMMAFECRYRINTVTASRATIFMGMIQSDKGTAVNDLYSTASAKADIDYLGFEIPTAAANSIDIVYRKGGASAVTVTDDVFGATTGAITGTTANTLTSSLGKWTKLGFLFDPNETRRTDGTNQDRIKFFVNGEPLLAAANIIDAGSSNPGIASSDFPDQNGMLPIVTLNKDGSTNMTFDVDWIRCAQFFPDGSQTIPSV